MNQVNLAENLIRLRHEKNVTQEQLADFLGVTKASVSKWENQQSMPDILLLPRLAVYFDVTIDTLIGYEPQLSKEQIQKIYQELALEFATGSWDEVMEKCREKVHSYYSCYPFLLQICILWFNHFMIPKEQEKQQSALRETETLCEHIIQNCNMVNICNDAISIKTMVELQMGKAAEVVEELENIADPIRFSNQNDLILIQAYQMLGDSKKARSCTQIMMYMHLLSLIGGAIQYLSLEMKNLPNCQETIKRMEGLFKIYKLEKLHPNVAAQFYYQSALVFVFHGKMEEGLAYLKKYVTTVDHMLVQGQFKLHGDDYFDCLEEWIEKLDLGAAPPRNRKTVFESFVESLEHPLFAILQDNSEFRRIKKSLSQNRGGIDHE